MFVNKTTDKRDKLVNNSLRLLLTIYFIFMPSPSDSFRAVLLYRSSVHSYGEIIVIIWLEVKLSFSRILDSLYGAFWRF